ncbi:deoxyribose-phosphate aldolase [Coccinella septempunctata]|uniref:deoxyribose-phosphate aldolase n=1 Tax=Coccinella septempunctata TaxID=41139 RepID=UPI001D073496|nr:deoxyribose-phosphate aldolase [Coccinella septempunctata]
MERNPGCELDLGWLNNVYINPTAVKESIFNIISDKEITNEHEAAWLLKAVTCIDLTTLGGDDTRSNVARLCKKAAHPIRKDILKKLGFGEENKLPIRTAAVCVYPSRVKDAVEELDKLKVWKKVNVASVATGFPCGQTSFQTRLDEIKHAIEQGATEIDVVINRTLVLTGKWQELYQEIQQMKEICGPTIHMKTILAVGELDSFNNVYKASLVAMMAGSDFIKTSTGKESINATLPYGLVMARAIREYYLKMGYKVGLKPAGGIRTSKDAISWLIMVKEILGHDWLKNDLFRFGASGLLGDIEASLYTFVYGTKPEPYFFSMG